MLNCCSRLKALLVVSSVLFLTLGCDGLSGSKKSKKSGTSKGAVGLKAAQSAGLMPGSTSGTQQSLKEAVRSAYGFYQAQGSEQGQPSDYSMCSSMNTCYPTSDLRMGGNASNQIDCSQTCLAPNSKPVFSCQVNQSIGQSCSDKVDYLIHAGSAFTMQQSCEAAGEDLTIKNSGTYSLILSSSDKTFNNSKLYCAWSVNAKLNPSDSQGNASFEGDICNSFRCSVDGKSLSCSDVKSLLADNNVTCEANAGVGSELNDPNSRDRKSSGEAEAPVDTSERQTTTISTSFENCAGQRCFSGEYCLSLASKDEKGVVVPFQAECRMLPQSGFGAECQNDCECAKLDASDLFHSTGACSSNYKCENQSPGLRFQCLVSSSQSF